MVETVKVQKLYRLSEMVDAVQMLELGYLVQLDEMNY